MIKTNSKLYNSQNNRFNYPANRFISVPGYSGSRIIPAQDNKKFIKLEPNVNNSSFVNKPRVQLLPRPSIRQNMPMNHLNGPSGVLKRFLHLNLNPKMLLLYF